MNEFNIFGFSGQYRFLSNFYPCRLVYQGIEYPTSEHAYQAAKTHLYDKKAEISRCQTPGQAKKLGKTLVLRPDWEDVKIGVMFNIVRIKFTTNVELRKLLLETNSKFLFEANYWRDQFWGVDQKTGIGNNYLGKILMEVREQLQHEGK